VCFEGDQANQLFSMKLNYSEDIQRYLMIFCGVVLYIMSLLLANFGGLNRTRRAARGTAAF